MDKNAGTNRKTVKANVAHSALRALTWQYGGAVLQDGVRFLTGVVLARRLSLEMFGIIGMTMIVIDFGRLLGKLGFGVAIIQRPAVTQKHIRAAFKGSTLPGVLLFSGIWFLAPGISRVFVQDG